MAVDCFPHGGLYDGPYTRVAVERYETLWLPLLAARPNDPNLIPPVDVAYAWLCHRLAPAAYAEDCFTRFGTVLHPATPEQALAFDDGSSAFHTVQLWGSVGTIPAKETPKYFPPKEPLSVTLCKSTSKYSSTYSSYASWRSQIPTCSDAQLQAALQELQTDKPSKGSWKSEFKYDVAGAMARQGGFLRNVLRASYSEMPFLQRAVDRYLRFVLLWRDSPGLKVVPMYDIDLMWHAHMVHSGVYQNDMHNIAGKVLNHDDNLEDSELSGGFTATKAAFEARWDMLYDPPLTKRVPAGEEHPAQKAIGHSLTKLLGGPLKDDIQAVILARQANTKAELVRSYTESARSRLREGKAAPASQAASAKSRTQAAKTLSAVAAATARAAYTPAETARAHAQKMRAAHDKAYPLQGGAALYSLYLVTKALREARAKAASKPKRGLLMTCFCGSEGCCGGDSVDPKVTANRSMVWTLKDIPNFRLTAAPFSHSHPFWSELSLVAYDSPVTVWRTPPGSAPGTLAATLAAVAASKGKAAPVMGFPSTAEGTPVYPSNVPTIYRGITPAAPPQPYNKNPTAPAPATGTDSTRNPTTTTTTTTNDSSMLMYGAVGTWAYLDLCYAASPQYAAPAMSASYCPYDCCALGGAYAATPEAAAQATPGDVGNVKDMPGPGSMVGGADYGDAAVYTQSAACAVNTSDLGSGTSSSFVPMGTSGYAGDVGYASAATSASCAAATCGTGAACGSAGGCGGCSGGGCGGCGGGG